MIAKSVLQRISGPNVLAPKCLRPDVSRPNVCAQMSRAQMSGFVFMNTRQAQKQK